MPSSRRSSSETVRHVGIVRGLVMTMSLVLGVNDRVLREARTRIVH